MRLIIILISLILLSCEKTSSKDLFEQYLWNNRVVLVFAPESENQLLSKQYKIITENKSGFTERDIVTWVIVNDEFVVIDGKQKANLPARVFYDDFNVKKNELTFILLGKDGEEKLRLVDNIVNSERLFNLIDSMPMRKQEIKQTQ